MKTLIINTTATLFLVYALCLNLSAQIKYKSGAQTEAIIKSDFLVNDDVEGDLYSRNPPQIATNSSGEYVVVWRDERNGNYDIILQRYAAIGEKVGENLRVNDDTGETEHWDPDVAINDSGIVVVTWCARILNGFHAYFQMYDSNNTPAGNNVQVDEESDRPRALYPVVDISNNGNFVIIWNTDVTGKYDVMGQLYNSDRQKTGENFVVNSDGETEYGIIPPSVGIDDDGNFAVCWADNRFKSAKCVYAQMYKNDGSPAGENFLVNDTVSFLGIYNSSYQPDLSMNNNGEFVIAWLGGGNIGSLYPGIYAKKFDKEGNQTGDELPVTDESQNIYPDEMAVAINNSGNIVVTWYDNIEDVFGNVYFQRFSQDGTPLGTNTLIDDFSGLGIQEYPAVAVNENNICFAFVDDHGNTSITGIKYSLNGEMLGGSFIINDDSGAALQQNPAVDMNQNGNFVLVWQDNREDFYDNIYIQRYDNEGNSIGNNSVVNDDGEIFIKNWYPDVTLSSSGKHIVTWTDYRSGAPEIYAQIFSETGEKVNANFKVNKSDSYTSTSSVASDSEGNFAIVWEDEDDDAIYAQWYSSDGTPLGENIMVSESGHQNRNMCNIAMNDTGRTVIVWRDESVYPGKIFGQIYSSGGNPVGSNFKCSESKENEHQYYPSVAVDKAGNFIVVWQDGRHVTSNTENWDIYARYFDSDGNPLGDEFMVNEPDTASQESPSVTMSPDGEMVLIFWTDYRKPGGNSDIMAQKYINRIAAGENQVLNQPDYFDYMHQHSGRHGLASNENEIVCVWMDNRRHKHWDIYSKIIDWGLIDKTFVIPNPEFLIYPNPAENVINVKLPGSNSDLRLTIFDLNGLALIDNQIPAGKETYSINVSTLKRGMYFFRISAGNYISTGKFIKN